MGRQVYVLINDRVRSRAMDAISKAGDGMVVEIKERTRTLEQNSKMWAMLTEISQQVEWYGKKLQPEDWKHIFSASLKGQEAVPGLDGGFVVLGKATSSMSVAELRDMIELMHAFGAEKEVVFSDVVK